MKVNAASLSRTVRTGPSQRGTALAFVLPLALWPWLIYLNLQPVVHFAGGRTTAIVVVSPQLFAASLVLPIVSLALMALFCRSPKTFLIWLFAIGANLWLQWMFILDKAITWSIK